MRARQSHAVVPVVESGSNEHDFVLAAVAGDFEALEQLYRLCAPDLLRWVAHIVLGSADVEDIVQDTFVSAFDGIRKLKEPAAFRSWLRTIALTKIRRTFRRHRLLRRLGLDSVESVEVESIASADAPREVLDEIRLIAKLLNQLPIDEGLALSLRRVEGYGLEEIAAIMNLSLATVKRRLVAAERQFAALLEAQR